MQALDPNFASDITDSLWKKACWPNSCTILQVQRKLPRGIREDRFVVTWSESWVHLNISQSIEDTDFWLRDGLCVSAMVEGVSYVPEPWRFSENNTGVKKLFII